jgi:hypothetical protein
MPGPRMIEDIPRRPIGEGHRSKHPVISFFQLLRQRFEDRMHQHQSLRLDPENDGGGDDGYLNITFSSIDDVIEFYRSDDDDDDKDSERDSEWEDVLDRIPGEEDCYEHVDDDDAIVSSWIDNYHYFLLEQEKRKQKQVWFEISETIDYSEIPSSNAIIFVDEEEEDDDDDDDCSLASSCCSSSTESTWRSLDTIEEQEFEEFANTWRDRRIQGKNTDKSLLGRLLWEVLVDPMDEDFEVDDEAAFDFHECEQHGTDHRESPGPMKNPDIETLEIFQADFGTDGGRFPSDLLFSIETQ